MLRSNYVRHLPRHKVVALMIGGVVTRAMEQCPFDAFLVELSNFGWGARHCEGSGAVRGVAGSVVAQAAVVDSVMSLVYVSVTSQRSRAPIVTRDRFALLADYLRTTEAR